MQHQAPSPAAEFAGYTPTAVILHWAMVLLLGAQYAIGWTMPEIHCGTQPETLINLHLSVGALVLVLLIVRAAWRLTHSAPPSAGLPGWQNRVSSLIHGLLYLLLAIVPVLGWMNASARGWSAARIRRVSRPPRRQGADPLRHPVLRRTTTGVRPNAAMKVAQPSRAIGRPGATRPPRRHPCRPP